MNTPEDGETTLLAILDLGTLLAQAPVNIPMWRQDVQDLLNDPEHPGYPATPEDLLKTQNTLALLNVATNLIIVVDRLQSEANPDLNTLN